MEKTWDATRGNKTIKCVKSNDAKGDEWYALRSGTFYIEAPTSARVQGESKKREGTCWLSHHGG